MEDQIETLECLDMNTVAKYIPGVFETIKAKHSFKKGPCNTAECCKKTCREVCSGNSQCDSNWENICDGNCHDISQHLFPKIGGPEYVQSGVFPPVPPGLYGRYPPEGPLPVIYPEQQEAFLMEKNRPYPILGTQYPYINTPYAYNNYSYMYLNDVPKKRYRKYNPLSYKSKTNELYIPQPQKFN
jgi:hypothetical protein